MDDRDHHDTNVVNLRRREDSGGRDRGQVASTIFADQDEISTFSQGNLVPPSPPPPPDEDSPRAADPFFEEHLRQPRKIPDVLGDDEVATETDEYFAQLVEQSATELADELGQREQSPAIALPGSASLPVDAGDASRRGSRLGRSKGARRRQPTRPVGTRVAVVAAATALLASAALAPLIVGLSNRPAAAPSGRAGVQLASILSIDRNPFSLPAPRLSSRRTAAHAGSRHAIRRRTAKSTERIRKNVRVNHVRRAATRPAAETGATSPAAVSQSAGAASSTQSTSAPATTTQSSSSGGQATTARNPPAFGSNGTLGPGHSSIG